MAQVNQVQVQVNAGVPQPTGNEPWIGPGTFGCAEDPIGCLWIFCCTPCAQMQIGSAMGDYPVGPKQEPAQQFIGCPTLCINYLTWAGTECCCCGPIIGVIACKEKCWCFYDMHIMVAVAQKLNKKTISPGPIDDPLMKCVLLREPHHLPHCLPCCLTSKLHLVTRGPPIRC